ncbi:MAG: hypothetical protein R2728_03965 [Chitinophagales bacterium]
MDDCTTNEPLDGFEGPSFTATANGSYAVIINGSSNCPDTSECIAIITTGVWDAIQTSINVYP